MRRKAADVPQPAGNARHILTEATPFSVTEEYKMLRTAVSFAASVGSGSGKTVGVTSPLPSEGKSITCMNLAVAFAMTGAKVLLIDCDLRKPTVAQSLNRDSAPGISNILAGACGEKEALGQMDSGGVRFDVIPSGDIPPNPSELLGSERAVKLFASLSGSYDYVFVDLPPVLPVSDTVAVSKWMSGLVMVVRSGQTKRDEVKHALERLRFADANVIGFVLNGAQHTGARKKHYAYYRHAGE
jgi:capsular exopolysaccharide synthesis family protein